MLIFVENGRTMILTHNIILLIFLSVTNTWAQSQVDLESNDLNEGDNGVKLLDNNDVKNNLRDGERVRVQLYYEVFDLFSRYYYVSEFMSVVQILLPYLYIDTYPFGNAKIIEDNDKIQFECEHGPDECYGNKLHACSLDHFGTFHGVLINNCLMRPLDPKTPGSDDETADRCGKLMNFDPETIKHCAKGTRGTELMLYHGELSKRENFSFVPHLLINGNMSDIWRHSLKDEICAAFINPPSNLRGSEKVRIQLYYECLCMGCIGFDVYKFAAVVETMSQYLDIQTYPFGNGDIIDDNGKVKIKCQNGPAECYGNKLHACALDKLQHVTALLFNICLMNSTDGIGSDDASADRCGKSMNVDSEPIKDCAKGARGTELLLYYGKESKKANFNYVPYVLINGKEFQGDDFKSAVCHAFKNPPPACK